MTANGSASWTDWWRVGCGVESLHDLVTARGATASLDDVLRAALAQDGYLDDVGWRHHALVQVASQYGIAGAVCPPLTIGDILDAPCETDWIISICAPEQFGETTHLVHVWRHEAGVGVFWPQGQLERGERFVVRGPWLGDRMTGRGMRFDAPDAAPAGLANWSASQPTGTPEAVRQRHTC